jgi:hypothetical protein
MGDYQHPLFTAFRGTRCKPLITLGVQYFGLFTKIERKIERFCHKKHNKIILDNINKQWYIV